MGMKHLNKATQKIFETLVEGLEPGQSRKVDNAPGVYMAVHVERLSKDTYAVAHYYERNGDLVPDPDMEFWVAETGAVFPIAIQMSMGYYQKALVFEDGKLKGYHPRALAEQVSFTTMWFRNIREQQGVKPTKKAA